MSDKAKTAFCEVMRGGWYLEHGRPVGTLPRGPRWEVYDMAGNLHASGQNVDEVIDTAWRSFERQMMMGGQACPT